MEKKRSPWYADVEAAKRTLAIVVTVCVILLIVKYFMTVL
jgi:hypothetical protein